MSTDPQCRSCRAGDLEPVIDFGPMPLADRLIADDDLHGEEPRFPLEVVWCSRCSLLQILQAPPPEVLFGADYLYLSSVSQAYVDHARRFAAHAVKQRGLGPRSKVVEIASNDGYLLRHFAERDIDVLGFEPSPLQADESDRAGIPTNRAFFTRALAQTLASGGLSADLVVANNVLAHVPDPNNLVAGVAAILHPEGIASFEIPYVRDLVEKLEFDTIYHEHHCYFSLHAIDTLMARNGLVLFDVERLAVHGGSLRVSAAAAGSPHALPSAAVVSLLEEERACGLCDGTVLQNFAGRVHRLIGDLRTTLGDLKAAGARIAAYGAAAKGATLLNAAAIDTSLLDFVVDRNPAKQGRFMPGVRLPVLAPEALSERRPDYVLLLTWNFAEEIFAQQAEYLARGGRFIVPVPEIRIQPPSD